jgi:hypothetical protein
VSGEFLVTNLFGEEDFPPQTGPGRPPHRRTKKTSDKVLLAFARGLTVKEAAISIGVSVSTLRDKYKSELKSRSAARLKLEMTQLERLNTLAEGGNVSAEKELGKMLERFRQRDQVQALAPTAPKQPKMGKKEAARRAAESQRGLYEPPRPPAKLN